MKLLQMGCGNFTTLVTAKVFTSPSFTFLTFPSFPCSQTASLSIPWLTKPARMWVVFSWIGSWICAVPSLSLGVPAGVLMVFEMHGYRCHCSVGLNWDILIVELDLVQDEGVYVPGK